MQATSHVSVDALTLRYNPLERRVEIAVAPRQAEPYLGQLALPGVLLWEGERLADATRRAVGTKLGIEPPRAMGQLVVFDEPARDPRGFTLSIAMWAVADGDAPRWCALDQIPPLAFDHSAIVSRCRPILADLLWRDLAFTRAITGPRFPVSDAVAITASLSGQIPDRGNLNRRLAAVEGLHITERRVVRGRGRPGATWAWLHPEVSKPVA